MLTRQQIIDTFVAGIDETPSDELIETYQNLKFTQQQLELSHNFFLALQTTNRFVVKLHTS